MRERRVRVRERRVRVRERKERRVRGVRRDAS